MTLVYICYSGYIFTNEPTDEAKLGKDGLYTELEGTTYKWKFYDENAIYAKYSDLGKSQYNYNKDNYYLTTGSEIYDCSIKHDEDEAKFYFINHTPLDTAVVALSHNGKPCENFIPITKMNLLITNIYMIDGWQVLYLVFLLLLAV